MSSEVVGETDADKVAERSETTGANGHQGQIQGHDKRADVEKTFDQRLADLLAAVGSAEERRAYADRLDELFPADC